MAALLIGDLCRNNLFVSGQADFPDSTATSNSFQESISNLTSLGMAMAQTQFRVPLKNVRLNASNSKFSRNYALPPPQIGLLPS